MRRVNGSRVPGLIECVDPQAPVYAVRWDLKKNEGLYGSSMYGYSYMEELISYKPSMMDIETLIADWSKQITHSEICGGISWSGYTVPLTPDDRLYYNSEYFLAIGSQGSNLPISVRCEVEGSDKYVHITTMDDLEEFFKAIHSHVSECKRREISRIESIDYVLYDKYINALEDMTELEKAKMEKRIEMMRVRDDMDHYYLEEEDVWGTTGKRIQYMEQARRGESVTLGKTTLEPSDALHVLEQMSSLADITDSVYATKLREVELAGNVDAVLAVDASSGYPEVPHTTTAEVHDIVTALVANSPEAQAVAFARQVINTVPMTSNQALERKVLFPIWGRENAEFGKQVGTGFRLRVVDGESDILYEVIKEHTISEEWKPGVGTESIYKPVDVDHAGTIEDPIPWEIGMELFNGKFYVDNEVVYECIRDSGQGMSFPLADLVSGGFVKVVEQ